MTIRNLGDIEALEAQPLATHVLPRTSYEALAATAAQTPEAKALTFFLSADAFGKAFVWTYAELLAEVTRAANAFHALGVTAEHPVAFVLPNLPETHFVIWGGEAAGAVLAINPFFEPTQVANLMKAARVRVLVTLAPNPLVDLWTKLAPALAGLPDLRTVALVDAMPYAGFGAGLFEVSKYSLAGVEVVDFRALRRAQPADRLLAPQPSSSDAVCSYFCTGGTTGAPKIAVRTHRNEIFDAWSAAHMVETRQATRTVLCGLPLFHVNAQLVTGLQAWMRGDHVVLATPEGYRGKNVIAKFWEIVAHYRIETFSGVPTIFSALMNVPVGDADISSLEFALCGAAPMPAKLIADFEAKTGLSIIEGYGLTEAGCVSSVNPSEGERRAGSIGLRIPYQQMVAAILDEAGRFLRRSATDEIGAILIHGPNVFPGYLDPQQNKGLFVEIDGEAWLNTGDLGRQDSEGYFWLTGRRKELIIRGGHNIDPKLIEEALQAHPSVALAAAIGSPDAHAGEVPVVYVQVKPGASPSEQELLEFAAARIPERAAIPKQVRIVADLPLTNVGKIFKPALQRREAEIVIRVGGRRRGRRDRRHRDRAGSERRRRLPDPRRFRRRSAEPGARALCLQVRSQRVGGLVMMRKVVMCLGPAAGGGFEVREAERRPLGSDEIEVAVAAASVNPIDVGRADGYGRRLLSLMGAARFPMTLGNDFAGAVVGVGARASGFAVGDSVYGLKPVSRDGSHASHIVAKAGFARHAPSAHDLQGLAALPYSFVTMWLAAKAAGLTRETAAGKSVLVHGAAGGLGRLALQTLSAWGARVTAVAKASDLQACREAGAAEVIDRASNPFAALTRTFDATLNFATWDDERALIGCLRQGALGHATTVHPMLRNFDEYGWVGGAWRTLRDKRQMRGALPKGASRYAWVLFQPNAEALAEMARLVDLGRLSLPIGIRAPLGEARKAFEHMRRRLPGRALIVP